MIRAPLITALLAASPAFAEPETYVLDPSQSQTLFSYSNFGYSTTWGMFSGWEGTLDFDAEDPANSSVEVSIPASALFTGWKQRDENLSSPDFFDMATNDTVSFVSTAIDVTGDDTAKITGDLTLGGVTRSIVLDARLNQQADHPQEGKPWVGFTATTNLLRSEFDAGAFAPFISDEVDVQISIEAGKRDD